MRCLWYSHGSSGVDGDGEDIMWISRRAIALSAMGLAALANPLLGQRSGDYFGDAERFQKPRVFIGGAFTVADPVGEFGLLVDNGFGVTGHVRFAADRQGILSVRLDGGFVQYGNERLPVCFEGVGCRVVADLVTTNNIAFVDVGPELGFDLGAVRPYAGASAGISYFHTNSSLDEGDYHYDGSSSFTTVNFEDVTFALRARGGMQFRVSSGRTPVYLDLGAVFHRNGFAEYLREGDIEDNADGSITLFPNFTEADLVTFQVGVSVGLGGGGDDHDHRRRGRRHPRH